MIDMSNLIKYIKNNNCCSLTAFQPLHIVDQLGLQQQVPLGQQVITDQVLVGSYSHAVTHTQRAKHIQDLKGDGS